MPTSPEIRESLNWNKNEGRDEKRKIEIIAALSVHNVIKGSEEMKTEREREKEREIGRKFGKHRKIMREGERER